jgi:hypothetical protein
MRCTPWSSRPIHVRTVPPLTVRRSSRWPLLLVGGVWACAGHSRLPTPRPIDPQSFRLTLTCFGPRQALLARGDQIQLVVGLLGGERGSWSCVRPRDPSLIRWSSSDTMVARITASGRVHGRASGTTTVRAEYRGYSAEREVRVIPPVRAVAWEPASATIAVGDTVRLEAVARDSTGRPVERLLPLAVGELEEQGGELVAFHPEGGVLVLGVRPGRLVLVAVLAHRADTAVVLVHARSR